MSLDFGVSGCLLEHEGSLTAACALGDLLTLRAQKVRSLGTLN